MNRAGQHLNISKMVLSGNAEKVSVLNISNEERYYKWCRGSIRSVERPGPNLYIIFLKILCSIYIHQVIFSIRIQLLRKYIQKYLFLQKNIPILNFGQYNRHLLYSRHCFKYCVGTNSHNLPNSTR